MVDLFPDQKIDLHPAACESPNWLAGFPQHARRLEPMVSALERIKTGALGLMEHVATVRSLATWIEFLFRSPAPLESCVDLQCTHRGTRTNCVTVELYFQVSVTTDAIITLAADTTSIPEICAAGARRADRDHLVVPQGARNARLRVPRSRRVCASVGGPPDLHTEHVSRSHRRPALRVASARQHRRTRRPVSIHARLRLLDHAAPDAEEPTLLGSQCHGVCGSGFRAHSNARTRIAVGSRVSAHAGRDPNRRLRNRRIM